MKRFGLLLLVVAFATLGLAKGPIWAVLETFQRPSIDLRLGGDGNLAIDGAPGGALWSTKTANRGGTVLVLDNTGNLTLWSSTQGAIWQSHSHG